MRVSEAEMLRRAEQRRAAADLFPGFVRKFIGEVAAVGVLVAEIHFLQPQGGQGGNVHGKAAALDHGGVGPAQRPGNRALEGLPGLVAHVQLGGLPEVKGFGVHVGVLAQNPFLPAGNQHRGKEPLFVIVQRLPAPEIIDAGPADHRPAVVQLPHNGAHAPAPVPPPVLHAVLDGLGLQELGGIDKGVEGRRI